MEKYVVENIVKDLKWYERIIVRILKKTFIKVYRFGMLRCFNFYNK